MTESEIQRAIVKYAETMGCIVIRMNAGKSGRSNIHLAPAGTPDLLIVHRGGVLWVEVKGPNGKIRDSQVIMHKRLADLGHEVIVARSVADVQKVLDR